MSIFKELRKEIAYHWRIQSIGEYGATCVAYIDARDAQDLLDEVVGPDKWQSNFKEVAGKVYGGISIKIGDEWITKWDCGTESNMEAEKGQASDAFKRACVQWGIGRFLYRLDIVKLKTRKHTNGKLYPITSDGTMIWDGEQLTAYIKSGSAPKDVVIPETAPAPSPKATASDGKLPKEFKTNKGKCHNCNKEGRWVKSAQGKNILVEEESWNEGEMTLQEHHIAHWKQCPKKREA